MILIFVETTIFTRRVQHLGLESGLQELQVQLCANPLRGDLDPGTGGLRKLRVADASRGKGKRGGARVHYLYLPDNSVVYLLFVYGKDDVAKLSASQKQQLKRLANAIRAEWQARSSIPKE